MKQCPQTTLSSSGIPSYLDFIKEKKKERLRVKKDEARAKKRDALQEKKDEKKQTALKYIGGNNLVDLPDRKLPDSGKENCSCSCHDSFGRKKRRTVNRNI